MEIRQIDKTDEHQLKQFWWVGKVAEDAYRPYDFYSPWEVARTNYLEGRPGYESDLIGAYDGDEMVGRCELTHPMLDNTHLTFVDLHVLPDHQRRGIGRALLGRAESIARERGRRTVVVEAYVPTGSDGPALAFARAVGYTEAMDEGIKVVDLVETESTWDAIDREVADRGKDYTLVAWADTVPDELVDGVCRLNEAFNDEAPSGELELEAERWDEARIRRAEAQNRRTGRHVLAVAALEPDPSTGSGGHGSVVGFTEVVVNDHAPSRGFQSGTLVLREHRGHALGLAMKITNHRAIRAAFPECRILMTGNAGVNAAMNAVNDRLGYREIERCVEVQKQL